MTDVVKSLGEFAVALVKLKIFHDKRSARDTVRRWIGYSDYQAFQASRLVKLNRINANAVLEGLLVKLGGPLNLPSPPWKDERDLNGKQAWLTAVLAGLSPNPVQQATEIPSDDPAWRRVYRPIQSSMAEKLKAFPLLTVVGMSGTGKTLLAQQYYEASPAPKAWFSAPRPGSSSVDRVTPSTLARAVLHFLATHADHYPGGRDAFMLAITELADELAADVGKALARRKESVREEIDKALLGLPKNPSTRTIIATIMLFAKSAQGLLILSRLCGIMVRCLRGDQHHLIVIDDVWDTDPASSTANGILPLIEALLPRADVAGRPLHILITSQERGSSFTRNALDAAARTLELDKDEPNPAQFAAQLVAAWATPGGMALTATEAQSKIAEFVPRLTEQGDLIAQRPIIEAVTREIGYHPLLTAAIASWWREQDYDAGVWYGMAAHLRQARPLERRFDAAAHPGGRLSPHHELVANALLHIVNTSLDPVQRARYFDLAIQPGGRALAPAISRLTWERVPREGGILTRSDADPIFSVFASRMLVQLRGKDMFLHDMHRVVIAGALGADGLAARHRDLLAAAGLLDADGGFDIDNPAHFRVESGDPIVPASGRWKLDLPIIQSTAVPPLRKVKSEIESYFMDLLVVHARAVQSIRALEDAELRLLTCLRFLQSQLDWIDAEEDQTKW